jgi:hypothetical protein
MVDLGATVAQVAAADVDVNETTVDQVSDALDELESQIDAVENAEDAVADAVRSDLRDAFDAYDEAIDDIDGDSTLAEAGAAVEAARNDFREAWDATLAELDCRPTQST